MSSQRFTFPVAGHEPALMTLPLPLSCDVLDSLESALGSTLDGLGRDLQGRAVDDAAIEYASWQQHLRPAQS